MSSFKRIPNLKISSIFSIGLIFFQFSCQKIEKLELESYYTTRNDVVAIEAAFSLVNSSLNETENNFLNATCNGSVTYKTCSLASGTDHEALYNWSTCHFDNSKISFFGSWKNYHYDDTCSVPMTNSKYMSRLTSVSAGANYTMPNNDIVTFNTNQHPTYPGQAMGPYGVETHQADANTRNIRIDAIRMTRKSGSTGEKLYDVFLHSGSAGGTHQITALGSLNNSNRSVNGYTHVYFQEKQRIKVNFNNLEWSDAACCYPKSGSLLLEYDNYSSANPTLWPSTGETSSLEFSNTCGEATITDTSGAQNKYLFTACY